MKLKLTAAFLVLCFGGLAQAQPRIELSGDVSLEFNYFANEGQFSGQDYHEDFSIAAEPEFYWESENGSQSLTFVPFYRYDQQDEERSHADIRELQWLYVADTWEARVGVGKVFWGVTEFVHLVDIINQTDGVESFDGEDKLGQPMVGLSRVGSLGVVDLFILPGFRERTFAGEDGRFRFPQPIDTDNARYQSSREEKHIDYAVRWSHSVSVFDMGVYVFSGTDRNPIPVIENNRTVPFYQQIDQVGLDLQATIGSWLFKVEALNQQNDTEDFSATQFGFEYTLYGVFGSLADLGLLTEYGWDERGEDALSVSQNDIYVGGRLTLNDSRDSDLLFGVGHDLDYDSQSLLLEASTRLSDNWSIEVQGIVIDADDASDVARFFDRDDRIQLTVERYF
jgi:hypothetical protein